MVQDSKYGYINEEGANPFSLTAAQLEKLLVKNKGLAFTPADTSKIAYMSIMDGMTVTTYDLYIELTREITPATGVTIQQKTGINTTVEWVEMNPEKPEMICTFVQNLNAISDTSEDMESGLKFLNWLYASKENHDLFHYGIEGVHYTPVGDDKIEYIKDENDNTLYTMDTWMSGYLPFMRFSSDAPDTQIDYMTYKAENAVVSPIAGFIFDASNVQTELSNLQTEIIASIYPIKVGMVSYEDNIDQAIANLKAAGLDTYLNEYRTQFSAYLEANPWVLEMAK